VRACHDVSDGGLAVAVAEMAMVTGVGATLELPEGTSAVGWLFGEEQGRYVLAIEAAALGALHADAAAAGVLLRRIGESGGDALTIGKGAPISIETLRAAHEAWLPRFAEGTG
jgi:phosphoribosylformylglycinamidine synthase